LRIDGRVRWQHGRCFFGGRLGVLRRANGGRWQSDGRLGVLRLHNDGRWQSDGRLGGLRLHNDGRWQSDGRLGGLGGRPFHGRPLVDVPWTAVVGGPKTVAKAIPSSHPVRRPATQMPILARGRDEVGRATNASQARVETVAQTSITLLALRAVHAQQD